MRLAFLEMALIQGGILSIGLVVADILVVLLQSSSRDFISVLIPSPQRTILAVKNLVSHRRPVEERVGFILGWLDRDHRDPEPVNDFETLPTAIY